MIDICIRFNFNNRVSRYTYRRYTNYYSRFDRRTKMSARTRGEIDSERLRALVFRRIPVRVFHVFHRRPWWYTPLSSRELAVRCIRGDRVPSTSDGIMNHCRPSRRFVNRYDLCTVLGFLIVFSLISSFCRTELKNIGFPKDLFFFFEFRVVQKSFLRKNRLVEQSRHDTSRFRLVRSGVAMFKNDARRER